MFSALLDSDNVSYILSAELGILRTNAAWERFARANGGEQLLERWRRGSSLLEILPEALRAYYVAGFQRASELAEPWEHDYECSSPTVHRTFRMIAYPFGGSFVVTHALLATTPHPGEVLPPSASYEHEGIVVMCAHCRRVRHSIEPERWDWVPAYLSAENVSHGLCTPCYRYYYGT